MYTPDDTIVAVATPPGRGGLAVVRLSGPHAAAIARALAEGEPRLEARRATLVRISPGGEDVRDEAVLTWFAAPASYTGEDVVEITLHGSPVLAGAVVRAAVRAGARLAGPGEFTLRAFLNGKLDLAQAEAVQDLVSATTPLQARMAFDQLEGTLSERIGGIEQDLFELTAKLEASVDFPEEGYHFIEYNEIAETLGRVEGRMAELLAESRRGRIVREGATVAIVGRPNVGKSTVFNRLAGSERAIVTEIPGTTRDLLSETVSLGGIPVLLVDTAGARETDDPVEREGVRRAERARESAALVVVILDASAALQPADEALLAGTSARARLIVMNKSDLPRACELPAWADGEVVDVSALTGEGMEALAEAVARRLSGSPTPVAACLSNVRHIQLLVRARENVQRAMESVVAGLGQTPEEIVLSELQATREALEEITGRRTTEDLLEAIFSRFCIGK